LKSSLLVRADDWPAATIQTVFSGHGERFVRIVPGKSIGDTVGFAGAPKGPYARGEFYARQPDRSYRMVAEVALQNPISPTEALLTDAGYLVTFDNWHNLGYGKILAIYRPDGVLVRAVTAEELYTAEQLRRIPMSVSSRWWRCRPHGFVDPDRQTAIYVTEYLGGTFTFQLGDGAFEYHPGRAECQPPQGPFAAAWFGR
jgi:hypothetical protein